MLRCLLARASASRRFAWGPLLGSSMTLKSLASEPLVRVRSRLPAAASMASRISSASSRRGLCRQTSRLAGSSEFRTGRELIRPAQHDDPNQLLDRPAALDEPYRQVVE